MLQIRNKIKMAVELKQALRFFSFSLLKISVFVVIFMVSMALTGCKGRKRGSSSIKKKAIDLKELGDNPQQAAAALTLSFKERDGDGLLPGFFSFRGQSKMVMKIEGSESRGRDRNESLKESFLVEKDKSGTLHALVENSHEYGWELFWQEDVIYYKNRFQPLVKRAGERREAIDQIEIVWSKLGSYWEMLSRFVSLKPSPRGEKSGLKRPVWRYDLVLRKNPLPQAFISRSAKNWRKTLKVTEIKGTVYLDKETAAPLKAEFQAIYSFKTPQEANVVTKLSYHHEMDTSNDSFEVKIPEAQEAPEREREFLDRRALLGRVSPPGWHRGGGPVRAWQKRRKNRRRSMSGSSSAKPKKKPGSIPSTE